jgi:hypothetical protein
MGWAGMDVGAVKQLSSAKAAGQRRAAKFSLEGNSFAWTWGTA